MEYRLCLNNLEQLVQFGFKINWTLLQTGYLGYDLIPPLFTKEDICIYATKQLESIDNNLVSMLICAENDEFEFILKKLAKNENVNVEIQIRKLRVLILFRQFKALPNDYTNGLIELTEVWISLGIPDDCPHIIQGRNNLLSPDMYYTEKMYAILKKRNFDWLDKEILYIISQDKSYSQ